MPGRAVRTEPHVDVTDHGGDDTVAVLSHVTTTREPHTGAVSR